MGEITREQISAIRTYYIGPHKEALRYMVISDILYDALPALLDMAEKALTEPSDPKPTSDLLSRLASAQIEVNARGWYGLDVLLNEAETAIRKLEMDVRKQSVYMDAYYDERVRNEIDDRYRFSDDDETYIETWEAAKAMREALEYAESRAAAAEAEVERLRSLINSPHVDDWFDGVRIEAAHQVERWGAEHDAGKTPLDWFWLIGYLAQKAVHAAMSEDAFKAKHHTISTGAALLNWYRRMIGDSTRMRPGLSDEAHQKIDGVCTALENKSDG